MRARKANEDIDKTWAWIHGEKREEDEEKDTSGNEVGDEIGWLTVVSAVPVGRVLVGLSWLQVVLSRLTK